MARIERAKGRRDNQSPSGYTRLFGVPALGQLMSRVHAAAITAGTELERMIWERVQQIPDLDVFLDMTLEGGENRLFVARKPQIKKSRRIQSRYEPDFIAFNPRSRVCYVIEVKDGDTFDTKKASGEHTSLHNFTTDVARALPYSTEIILCAFNARTRDEIFSGLKGRYSRNELMTGRELCELLSINYDEIVNLRNADQQANFPYFLSELLRIDAVRAFIATFLRRREDRERDEREQ